MVQTFKMPPVKYDMMRCAGGLDQITPSLALPAGIARSSSNFECAPTTFDAAGNLLGGYTRIAGYERYDGRPSPSAASYATIQVSSFVTTPTVGQTLTGATSGATGVIIALGANYLILTKLTGTFSTSEVVKVGATTIGTAVPATVSLSALLNAQYLALAADQYRTDILVVPGSGPIRGVFGAIFNNIDYLYAFRDNVGGTATLLYQASVSGWTLVPFFNEVSFTAGGAGTPADGATLTQGGVTATIKRVVLQSGSWAASSAAGRFIVTNPVGGNFAAGAATAGAVGVTLSGVQTAITFQTGGKFETDIGNFAGQPGSIRVYGCDGVNRAFEFDGTTLVPIATGTTPDAPKHLAVHKNQLMLAIQGSLLNSSPGLPYDYTAINGSAELAVGDTITNIKVQPGTTTTAALLVVTQTTTQILYGTGASSWNLVRFNVGVGGLDYTVQNMFLTYVLDDPGVIALQTTLAYGNFVQSTLTSQIFPYIVDKRSKIAYSSLYRAKSQYRLFFSDGSGLYLTIINGKLIGSMPVNFADAMFCAWDGMLANGNEVAYVGGANSGYVYQLEMGSSFDGKAISAYCTFNWNPMRSPRLLKQFRKASIEMEGSYYANIQLGYALGYGSSAYATPAAQSGDSGFTGAPNWDSVSWDNFIWDGQTIAPTDMDLTGTAENIQYTISSATNYIYPYTINSIITHYTPRRGVRF